MRKIVVGAMVSIDGVMQGPGSPAEDRTGGFRFGGWVMPHFDEVFGEELDRLFEDLASRRLHPICRARVAASRRSRSRYAPTVRGRPMGDPTFERARRGPRVISRRAEALQTLERLVALGW